LLAGARGSIPLPLIIFAFSIVIALVILLLVVFVAVFSSNAVYFQHRPSFTLYVKVLFEDTLFEIQTHLPFETIRSTLKCGRSAL
jgi:hypothetical protein